MPSIWLDNVPRRDLDPDLKRPLSEETRKLYGFHEIDFFEAQRTIILACNILNWLLKDLEKLDQDYSVPDSQQLRDLIRYFYHTLITAFKMEADSRTTDKESKLDAPHQALTNNIIGLEKRFRLEGADFGVLGSRTLLELLARIITQKPNPPLSLKQYKEEFDKLEITKGLKEIQNHFKIPNQNPQQEDGRYNRKTMAQIHAGIPNVIFICIHTTDGDVGPKHVISTSREKWPGLKVMNAKAFEKRKERLQNLTDIENRTKRLSSTIEKFGKDSFSRSHDPRDGNSGALLWKTKRSKKQEKQEKQENKEKYSWRCTADKAAEERMLKARKEAVLDLQERMVEPEKLSHRKEDDAAAFFIPDMKISGRCFKCQSLYPFTMNPKAQRYESSKWCMSNPLNSNTIDLPGSQCWSLEGYPAGSCAEDLAYPICKDVNRKHRTS